ncbi:hypothetical protein C8R45DRAFT_1077970, partial [Mycena sanguinolenta]
MYGGGGGGGGGDGSGGGGGGGGSIAVSAICVVILAWWYDCPTDMVFQAPLGSQGQRAQQQRTPNSTTSASTAFASASSSTSAAGTTTILCFSSGVTLKHIGQTALRRPNFQTLEGAYSIVQAVRRRGKANGGDHSIWQQFTWKYIGGKASASARPLLGGLRYHNVTHLRGVDVSVRVARLGAFDRQTATGLSQKQKQTKRDANSFHNKQATTLWLHLHASSAHCTVAAVRTPVGCEVTGLQVPQARQLVSNLIHPHIGQEIGRCVRTQPGSA